jgi:hypothetical protein
MDSDPESSEHLWFTVTRITDGKLSGILMHPTYYISSMKEGDTYDLPYENVSGWYIDSAEYETSFTPDNAYLLSAYVDSIIIPMYASSIFNNPDDWRNFVQNLRKGIAENERIEKYAFLYNS